MLTQYFDDLGPAGPRRRRAGRRPREAEQEVRLEDRRRAGDPRQGAPRPAGRRDRLRHRRRAGKTAVIVDDIIDTAGTLRAAGQTVLDAGAARGLRRRDAPGPVAATPSRTSPPRASSRSSSPTRSRCAPGAPDNIRVLSLRRAADRLDPPDLHRRLGERGLRRREPAVLTSTAAAHPACSASGCGDDELCAVLDVDPLTLIGGELDHRPELRDPARADRGGRRARGGGRAAPLGAARRARAAARSTTCWPATSRAFEDDLAALARARLRAARRERRPAS